MGSLLRLRKDAPQSAREERHELTDAELRDYEMRAVSRYTAMAKMDLPREERAAHARKSAARVRPLAQRAW